MLVLAIRYCAELRRLSAQPNHSSKIKNNRTRPGLLMYVGYTTHGTSSMTYTNMTKPRYEMSLTQHTGGNIEGKCVEASSPAPRGSFY